MKIKIKNKLRAVRKCYAHVHYKGWTFSSRRTKILTKCYASRYKHFCLGDNSQIFANVSLERKFSFKSEEREDRKAKDISAQILYAQVKREAM